MTKTRTERRIFSALFASAMLATAWGSAASAQDVLRSLTAFPSTDKTAE